MQAANSNPGYQTRAFAALAGVTVRTLHHYDRLGLLKPGRRSGKGYRLYQQEDLERLEQIVALKFLGFTLGQIRSVLDRKTLSLLQELERQRTSLLDKRRLMDEALMVLEQAQAGLEQGAPQAVLLRRIIEVISMQNDSNWMMKYYSPEAQAKIAERAKTSSPGMQEEISQAWKDYYHDLAELKYQDDPNGAAAAQLAKRHHDLVAAFTGNDPAIEAGLRALYKDQANWTDEMKARMAEYL